VKKERILAIIAIVLSFICLFPMMTIYDFDTGHYVPTVLRLGEELYPEEFQNQI